MTNKFLKLKNGDMIVAKLVSETGGDYVLSEPRMIMPAQNNSISFFRYNMFGKSPQIVLDDSDVLFMDDLDDEIVDHYEQLLKNERDSKSGIITPNAQKIIT